MVNSFTYAALNTDFAYGGKSGGVAALCNDDRRGGRSSSVYGPWRGRLVPEEIKKK